MSFDFTKSITSCQWFFEDIENNEFQYWSHQANEGERQHTQLKQMIWLLEAQKLLSVKYIHWVQMGGMLVQKVNILFK